MKKFTIIAFAALLVVAFTVPAAAVESVFGGYWRTRVYSTTDFSGDDTGSADETLVDTRTRLYYTAILNDNLKFVNKFEFDTNWGTPPLGDIGADGQIIEIKNSYADFNVGAWNAKVGIQGLFLARGLMADTDFSGVIATYKGEGFSLPILWIKEYEGGQGIDFNDYDVDMIGLNPSFTAGDMTLNPFLLYATSKDISVYDSDVLIPPLSLVAPVEATMYWIGLNLDTKFDAVSLWLTAIMESGELSGATTTLDSSGFLAALGASTDLGGTGVHGQILYATGDDVGTADEDESFMGPTGQSYYWAEIMGLGIFDDYASANAPADVITDIMAFNVGVTYPMDKLTLSADLWYANLAEDDTNGNADLGIEIDLKATYALVENLNLDVVVAYLSAGDATTGAVANEGDPMEIGARLSLSF